MRLSITSRRRLAATLTTTLRAKAAQASGPATTAAARFDADPARRPPAPGLVDVGTGDLLDERPPWDGRPPADAADVQGGDGDGRLAGARRRRLVPIAAVALAAAVIGATVAVRLAGSDDGPVDNDVTVGSAPEGWLIPTWVPDGLDLWDMDWQASSRPTDPTDPLGPFAGVWSSHQLFGDPDGGRALYVQTSSEYEVDGISATEPVTVRGHDGWAGPAVDTAPEPVDSLVWNEAGATVTVFIKDMTTAEAIAAVEAMTWRSSDPESGFAPSGDGSLPLRGESLHGRRGVGRRATFVYSDGAPTDDPDGGLTLRISTSTETAAMPIGYLDDWFYNGDDRPPADDGARHVFDAESHELRVTWPDGREVYVSPVGGPSPDRDVLERIVASMTVGTDADLRPLQERFVANVEELPVEATAQAGVGALEVHGEGPFHRLCLRRADEPGLDCGHGRVDFSDRPPGAVGDVTTSWVIDGAWYVGVAANGFEPQVLDPRNDQPLTGEATADGGWRLRLVRPPAELPAVGVTTDATGGFLGLPRPT